MTKFILFISFVLFTITSHAKMDPSINWNKIETAHFEIIFNEKHEALGRRYAEYAELAYQYLIPIFKEAPEKTALIINDNTDQANGYATYLPYPHMMIYPTLPLPDMTIGSFDYWGLGLIIHEYAHILSFYPAHGVYTPFKYIFGSVVRPLALTPRWYLEGLAVAMETRFTTQGRLRSADTQAAIRAYIKDKKLHKMSMSKINEGNDTWPYGGAPYLFGSLIWQKAIDEKGEGVVYKLLQDGSRKFPFTVNSVFNKQFNSSLQDFLTELYVEAEEKYKPIKTNEVAIKMDDEHRIVDFAISPDNKKMITLQTSPDDGSRILLHTRTKKEDFKLTDGKVLVKTLNTERIGWLNDSNTIYFDKVDTEHKRFNLNFKIFKYDIKSKKQTKISKESRDIQPHFSPNNKKIVYVKNGPGQNSLYISKADGNGEKLLYKPDLEVRLSYPTFYDNDQIIFTERTYSGEQILYSLNVNSKEKYEISNNDKQIFKIKKSGKYFLFVTTENGTKNITLSKPPFLKFRSLTKTNTAINNAIWDSATKKLYLSQLTSDGNKAFTLSKNSFLKSSPDKAPPVIKYDWPSTPKEKESLSDNYKVKNYSPWKYLIPRYWIPYAFNVNDGFVFQGSTFAKDPLDKHAYSLGLSYDTITERPSYSAAYKNSSTFLDITMAYGLINEPLTGTNNFYKHTTGLIGASFYLPGMSNAWRGALGGKYLNTQQKLFPDSDQKIVGPTASISYGKTINYGRQLNKGVVNFSLSHDHFLALDDYNNFDMTRLNFVYNFNHFLPKKHHLIIRLNGAYSDNLTDNDTENNNDVITYGVKTLGGNYIGNLVNSNILMRGYNSGAFTASQMAVGSLSYGFPVVDSIYKGPSTGPIFFKSISANIFTDAIGLKGRYIFTEDENTPTVYRKTDWDKVFVGSGFEVSLNTTIAYHVPVSFVLGGYYGYDEKATGGFSPFITLAIGGLDGLAKNKDETLGAFTQ